MLDLTVTPECTCLAAVARTRPRGAWRGRSLEAWRRLTRHELGLDEDRPIIATGHQTLLWHPGILAKYILVDAVASSRDLATANLIVDQHASAPGGTGGFGDLEIPVRRGDGALAVQTLRLTDARPEVPMALHDAFTPTPGPRPRSIATPSAESGLDRIVEVVAAHRHHANAAIQMAEALGALMAPWVRPMPNVTATALMETSLARAVMDEMLLDPETCAASYNRAIAEVDEVRIKSLLIRDDYVELPLWRIRPDGRRMHAYDNDVADRLAGRAGDGGGAPMLMPRALFMTALVRLGMCDLFVHGTGGARYDVAMETWIADWLGIETAPIAVATATMHLELHADAAPVDVDTALAAYRRAWHDPESADRTGSPGAGKQELLRAIDEVPRRTPARRRAFHDMHRSLEALRERHADAVQQASDAVRVARRAVSDSGVAHRRTWAFPLYAPEQIDELSEEVRRRVQGGVRC